MPGRTLTEDGLPATALPSFIAEPDGPTGAVQNEHLGVEIAFSITGPLRLPDHAKGLWLLDSLVDGVGTPAIEGATAGRRAPAAWLERVTLLGDTAFKALPMASEVLFVGHVDTERRQEGCVRFSFVQPGSLTPRRYRCQPDLEVATQVEEAEREAQAKGLTLTQTERDAIRVEIEGWLVPAFTSDRYGQPAYCQLHLACPAQIRTGAEDGSEMGAFCHLKQPQRESNLRRRLEEYLPFGLEPGFVYVT